MKKFTDLTSKTARVEHIREMLKVNDKWAVRGLLRIYEYQTQDEKSTGETRHLNNVGFNGPDANILSSFARQINNGKTMSGLQMKIIHKNMPKYAGQLEKLSTPKN